MDLVIMSSAHSKKVFEEAHFEQKDKRTDAVIKSVKLTTPIEVLFEGIDKIETYPRPQTWFLISNPDTTIAKLQFEKFKFRYKFIINGRNDQIIEVESSTKRFSSMLKI